MSFEKLKLDPYHNGDMLLGIYMYQKHIMAEYKLRGAIPAFADHETREGQQFLKKGIYWVIEELMEAKEQYDGIWAEYTENPSPNLGPQFEKYFGELADSMHFMVELFIYSGIEEDDILSYYEALCKQRNLEILTTADGLTTAFNYGQQTNNFDDQVRIEKYSAVVVPGIKERVKISQELYILSKLCTLEVVHTLCMAGNLLKKRDWKQDEGGVTPLQEYHYKLMEAWLFLFKLLDLVGLDAVSFYEYYEKMNIKNQERILNNY